MNYYGNLDLPDLGYNALNWQQQQQQMQQQQQYYYDGMTVSPFNNSDSRRNFNWNNNGGYNNNNNCCGNNGCYGGYGYQQQQPQQNVCAPQQTGYGYGYDAMNPACYGNGYGASPDYVDNLLNNWRNYKVSTGMQFDNKFTQQRPLPAPVVDWRTQNDAYGSAPMYTDLSLNSTAQTQDWTSIVKTNFENV